MLQRDTLVLLYLKQNDNKCEALLLMLYHQDPKVKERENKEMNEIDM